MSKKKKKILVCGAGSIGVYIGTMLHLKGHDVKLFGRQKLREVKETIIINGKTYEVPEKIFRFPKVKDYSPDFIFVTTKLYDFDKMINLIKKNRIKYSGISAVQNGLVDTSKHSKILGKRITPVVVFSGFNLSGGEIMVNPTKVGWITESSGSGKKISRLLLGARIPCKPTRNFDSLRAEKTIVNCCLNALSAIENKTFCTLFRNKKAAGRINKLFDECHAVLSKEHRLEKPEKMKKNMLKNWAKLNHYSSTCQDIKSGRQNEVKYFNGYVAELGRKYRVPVGENLAILDDINKISKR